MQQQLWHQLVDAACSGRAVLRGIRHGSSQAQTISFELMRNSKPDLEADTLEAAGVLYHAVSVFEAPVALEDVEEPARPALPEPAPKNVPCSG